MPALTPLEQLDPARFETPGILKKLTSSSRKLAELKGIAASIPNQGTLINALALGLATALVTGFNPMQRWRSRGDARP